MPSWNSYSPVYGQLISFAVVGILVVLLRWAFGHGRSLVQRPAEPGSEDEYGLLVSIASPSSFIEAELLRAQLAEKGLRATVANTSAGPRLMVFSNDERAARQELARSGH